MSPQALKIAVEERRLQVSLYDRVSSWLLAFLIAVGAAAALLLVLWLSNKLIKHQTAAVPVRLIDIDKVSENGQGGGNGRAAGGSQLVDPSEEPFVGKDKKTTDVQDNLSVLDNTVASRAAKLDDPSLLEPTRHGSFGSGNGIYGGFGDGRGTDHGPDRPGKPGTRAAGKSFFPKARSTSMPGNSIPSASNWAFCNPTTKSSMCFILPSANPTPARSAIRRQPKIATTSRGAPARCKRPIKSCFVSRESIPRIV